MFLRFLLFLVLLGSAVRAQGEWEKIESPVSNSLYSVFITDSLHMWAAGDSGTIIYSSDTGRNWTIQQQGKEHYLTDIFFLDTLTGWAVGSKMSSPLSTLYETTDGGSNWHETPFSDEFGLLRSIFFFDSLNGFISGGSGVIIRTNDGGSSWKPCEVDSFRLDLNFIKFVTPTRGFACGGIRDLMGLIYRTTDGGDTWVATPTPFEPLWEIYYTDTLNYLAVGGDYEYGASIVKTTNAGDSWDYRSLDFRGVGTSISFRTDSEVWAALGSDRSLIYSTDSGSNWSLLISPDSSILNDLEFADSVHGIAVGEEGTIYRFNNNPVSISDQDPGLSDFYVRQNYPNPFNGGTVIEYYLHEASQTEIKITDILGNEIIELSGFQNRGNHKERIALNSAAGVYFYSVSAGGRTITGKMIYLK